MLERKNQLLQAGLIPPCMCHGMHLYTYPTYMDMYVHITNVIKDNLFWFNILCFLWSYHSLNQVV